VTNEHGHILVVDDNRMNRIKLARGLEQQGHTVAVAEHGQQAIEMLRTEPFDVVLLDILMPEMDGYEVLERIKSDSALRDIPVIVISALDEMDSVVRCIEMGAEDYLPKPFNPVLLKARLSASLQKKKLRDLERAYCSKRSCSARVKSWPRWANSAPAWPTSSTTRSPRPNAARDNYGQPSRNCSTPI